MHSDTAGGEPERDRDLPVAVLGASGYTGSRAATEIAARGRPLLLLGRSRRPLDELAAELPTPGEVRVVELEDAVGLRSAIGEAAAVVNAVGPFRRTARPVLDAALATRTPYIDCSAEQLHTLRMFERDDGRARAAGIPLCPGFGFFHAIADLLAAAAPVTDAGLDAVDIGYWILNWRATRSTVATREDGLETAWFHYDQGVRPLSDRTATRWFQFPEPVGRQRVATYPLGDVVTVPRWLPARRVSSHMSVSTMVPGPLGPIYPQTARLLQLLGSLPLRPLASAILQGGKGLAKESHDPSEFMVALQINTRRHQQTVWAEGREIYGITAPLLAEGVEHLIDGVDVEPGVRAPAEVMEATRTLEWLSTLPRFRFSFYVPGSARPPVGDAIASG